MTCAVNDSMIAFIKLDYTDSPMIKLITLVLMVFILFLPEHAIRRGV